MSNTIEHDYQYKGLMYASIAESKHFNDEAMDNGMRIIGIGMPDEYMMALAYTYIPAANKSEMTYHTPTKRGTIRKAFDLLCNIFNKTK